MNLNENPPSLVAPATATPRKTSGKSMAWLTACVSATAGVALFALTAHADRDQDRDMDDGHGDRGHGHQLVASPHSKVYGKSLSEWLSLYWRWYYGSNQDPASSMIHGVQLLPLPNGDTISGTGTPTDPSLLRGHLEITIDSETPLVLPLAAWTSERYNNGTPDDADIDNAVFLKAITPHFTIDNQLVVTDANEANFYVPPTPFNPMVVYPTPTSYGSVGAIRFQSIGVVIRPLSVGVHVIHLDESYILPGFFGAIFDNTWVVTVKKAHHERH